MWMQTGCCEGYKVCGLQEQRDAGWRVTTWPEGKDKPQNNYWVKEGVFFRPRPVHESLIREMLRPLQQPVFLRGRHKSYLQI
jgi:hypothetical protein